MYNNYGFDKFINRPELRNTIRYIVVKGDTLYEIAKKYNTTVAEIISLNNLNSNMIYPNQVLFIKDNSVKNQTLKSYMISKGYDYSGLPEDILMMDIRNPISCDLNWLSVSKEDTLDLILSKTNLTPYQLLELNKSKWLAEGEKIIIK